MHGMKPRLGDPLISKRFSPPHNGDLAVLPWRSNNDAQARFSSLPGMEYAPPRVTDAGQPGYHFTSRARVRKRRNPRGVRQSHGREARDDRQMGELRFDANPRG